MPSLDRPPLSKSDLSSPIFSLLASLFASCGGCSKLSSASLLSPSQSETLENVRASLKTLQVSHASLRETTDRCESAVLVLEEVLKKIGPLGNSKDNHKSKTKIMSNLNDVTVTAGLKHRIRVLTREKYAYKMYISRLKNLLNSHVQMETNLRKVIWKIEDDLNHACTNSESATTNGNAVLNQNQLPEEISSCPKDTTASPSENKLHIFNSKLTGSFPEQPFKSTSYDGLGDSGSSSNSMSDPKISYHNFNSKNLLQQLLQETEAEISTKSNTHLSKLIPFQGDVNDPITEAEKMRDEVMGYVEKMGIQLEDGSELNEDPVLLTALAHAGYRGPGEN